MESRIIWSAKRWASRSEGERKGHTESHSVNPPRSTCNIATNSLVRQSSLSPSLLLLYFLRINKSQFISGWERKTNLYFVVRWCTSISISSFANSLPGHEWVPFPNGMYVLGFGDACHIMSINYYHKSVVTTQDKMNGRDRIGSTLINQHHNLKFFTLNLDGSNLSGSGKKSGL